MISRAFTVLIVDDETAIRNLVAEMLSETGFQMFAASNGYDAVRILGERPVDLLLTDIVMPGMNGVQLAAQAKLIRPGIKVLFATGYAQKAAAPNVMRLGRVLFKPFRRDLIREVESLLAA